MAAPRKKIARKDKVLLSAEEVHAEIFKKHGDVIVLGSELRDRIVRRATSGSLAFDLMLGGGWPLNQWNEIIGNPSSGKSIMIMKTVAANQRVNPNFKTLWVASEHFVSQWAETAGMSLDNVEVVETNVMETAFDIVIKYLDNRLVDCIVIDSLPALTPADEDEHGFDEWQVGLGARLTGKFFRKAGPAQRRSLTDEDDRDCLLLIVNQWRFKIGVMFGDPRTTSGGAGKDYFYFTRVETSRAEWLEHDDRRVGIAMKAHTVKNKTAPVERIATVHFYYDEAPFQIAGNYDEALDVFSCATTMGVLEKNGSTYSYGEFKAVGKEKTLAALREDIGLRRMLQWEVLRSQGIDMPRPVIEPEKPVRVRAPRKPAALPPPKKLVKR